MVQCWLFLIMWETAKEEEEEKTPMVDKMPASHRL